MEAGESFGRELRERIRRAAEEIGFARVGFAGPTGPEPEARLRHWLERGFHGRMGWMERDPEGRCRPDRILTGLRSAVCVALRYGRPEPVPPVPGRPRISRYAWGRDYHEVVDAKLRRLEERIREAWEATPPRAREEAGLPPELLLRRACDTSPVMDKAWAAAAGLGWLGRNTCLIHPREGSWLFLGEIFTNLPLPPDPALPDRCGDCRRCLEACPTGALVAPYQLDARRCISYLTIEHRGDFDPWEARAIGDWIVGCDICQEVCPWNRRAPYSDDPAFAPDPRLVEVSAGEWAALPDDAYRERVRGTALTRLKAWMMRRNAGLAAARLSSARGAEAPPDDGAPG